MTLSQKATIETQFFSMEGNIKVDWKGLALVLTKESHQEQAKFFAVFSLAIRQWPAEDRWSQLMFMASAIKERGEEDTKKIMELFQDLLYYLEEKE